MAAFTQKAIKESFIKLIEQKPYSQITVKEIAEECGINRNSFYYHFADLPDLVEEIMSDEIDRIMLDDPSVNSLEESFCRAIRFALENKRAIYHIYDSVNRDILEGYLMKASGYVARKHVNNITADLDIPDEDKELLITSLKYICFGASVEWMESRMEMDISSILHASCEMLNRLIPGKKQNCFYLSTIWPLR